MARDIKTVGIKELKNNLSAYLREVRRGTQVLVSDRNRVVAELREPGARYETGEARDPMLDDWIRSGVVGPPLHPKKPLPASPVSSKQGLANRLLDRDRGEGRT